MTKRQMRAAEGNEAVTSVAHRINEVCAIYPITPSSNMGEMADAWSAEGQKNIWGIVPEVIEMQSEAGAAGAVHGALQAGSLTTTFTASQGLLLFIPSLYLYAGELTSMCMHVSARTVATHGLSIFGDHSDVMSTRMTGMSLLCSGSVQEAHDMACIGQAASMKSRIPVLHFFDGFRTSHEINVFEELTNEDLHHMMPPEDIAAHRARAMTPDAPTLRGTSQNPDHYFQMQEGRNLFYEACPNITQEIMDKYAALTGRQYKLFDYVGDPEAEKVIIIMGTGAEVAHETIDHLNANGEKLGLLKVRLYRPFSLDAFISALPASVKKIAVCDRTKENGGLGEPLYMDVLTAFHQAKQKGMFALEEPLVVGGRYGLSSKDFTPAMVKAIYDNLDADTPQHPFTVGIMDDVTHLSLKYDPDFSTEKDYVKKAVFFGLGSDGTVGANKNSIKIISENTDNYSQGYFQYDSKKAGAVTTSHVRFSPEPIQSSYLIHKADFVACHQFQFIEEQDMLKHAAEGATFLVNAPYPKDEVWDKLPSSLQQEIVDKKLNLWTIDATQVAIDAGMAGRINTIMQTCFFAISGVLPRDEAIAQIKGAIEKTYGRKGEAVVKKNFEAVDMTVENLFEVDHPNQVTSNFDKPPIVSDDAPDFVKKVSMMLYAGMGELLPVSAFPVDGVWPTDTAKWEKRNIGHEIPVWIEELCIQCNKCAMVCPHAAIRVKAYDAEYAENAPSTFKSMDYKGKEFGPNQKYTVQVAPEDCTGCTLCVKVCPGKDKKDPSRLSLKMELQRPLRETERENWDHFLSIPEIDRTKLKLNVKGTQFAEPLMEFSGACAACGETPYIKLMTQMYGDRALIGNATGCSSIYGGNLPTTPYSQNADGRGPTWNNSLFEDTAEFSLGMRLAVNQHRDLATLLCKDLSGQIGDSIVSDLLAHSGDRDEAGVIAQRTRVVELRQKLEGVDTPEAKALSQIADYLVHKSVWAFGGDGWAYDIGYGGLDHILGCGEDVNLLVMDTEVYSNTGGQMSKATPIAGAAKFAVAGRALPKKDLGLIAITYGSVYTATVAFGSKDAQTVNAFKEAESYPGVSCIIAYSPCIEHGYDMTEALVQMEGAVDSGYWPLYRYDPRRLATGEKPFKLDSKRPKQDLSQALAEFYKTENRFAVVARRDPERYAKLLEEASIELERRWQLFELLTQMEMPSEVISKAAE